MKDKNCHIDEVQRGEYSVGSVPLTKISVRISSLGREQFSGTKSPVLISIVASTIPFGRLKSEIGVYLNASLINSFQIGVAFQEPY